MTEEHKATIETLINTAALALTSFAVVTLTTTSMDGWTITVKGIISLALGMGLEFFKYWGRSKELW